MPLYILRKYILFHGYRFYTLRFRSDGIPFYYQILRTALNHKERNEFSVVFLPYLVYRSIKFPLVDAILTSY